jgi:2-C-methyl-D-erythritol 2,4-cyclodiphosphate synthase
VVVVIEQPKLLPYRDAICREVAELLGIDAGRVSLKAKTAEGLGPIGRGEAAEAHAVATILSSSQP